MKHGNNSDVDRSDSWIAVAMS